MYLAENNQVTAVLKDAKSELHDVSIYGADEKSQKIMITSWAELHNDRNFIEGSQIIFVTTQSQHTELVAAELSTLIPSNVTVVSMQNGTKNYQKLRKYLPLNPVVLGSVWWSATKVNEFLTYYHRKAITYLGNHSTDNLAKNKHVSEVFNQLKLNFEVEISTPIDKILYQKLALNVVAPCLALMKLPYPEGLNVDAMRELTTLVFFEALKVLDACAIPTNSPDLQRFKTGLLHPTLNQSKPSPHKVSTQISIEKYGGEGSNAGVLIGEIIELADSTRVEVPHLKRLLTYIIKLQRDYSPLTEEDVNRLIKSGEL